MTGVIRHTAVDTTSPTHIPPALHDYPLTVQCPGCGCTYQHQGRLGQMYEHWLVHHRECEVPE